MMLPQCSIFLTEKFKYLLFVYIIFMVDYKIIM
jgi:hypothetical protein